MAIREGRWDCPSCGSRGQLGRNVECTGCGAPRPQGIRFYLPGNEPPVTDAQRLAQARAGADWTCEHCGGSARATEGECPGCGAPRGSSPARPVLDLDNAQVPRSSADAEAAEDADRAAERARKAQAAAAGGAKAGAAAGATPAGKKKDPGPPTARDWLIVGCTGCGGLGALGFILLFLIGLCTGPDGGGKNRDDTPRPAASAPQGRTEHFDPFTRVIVTGRRWMRSVMVEELRLVHGRGERVPEGAEVLGSSREVTGSRRVFDHNETRTREVSERVRTGTEEYVCGQRDLGNGYFEDRVCTRPVYETQTRTERETEPVYRDEPVYGTVYRYRRWEWQHDTTLAAESHDSVPPRWPVVRETRTRKPTARNEIWAVDMRAVNGPQTFHELVDSTQYRRLWVGDTVRVILNGSDVRSILPIFRGKPPSAAAPPSADSAKTRGDTAAADTPRRSTSRTRRSGSGPRRTTSERSSGTRN